MVEVVLYAVTGLILVACGKLAVSARRAYRQTILAQEKSDWAYNQSVRALAQLHSNDTDKILAGLQTIVMLNDYEIRVAAFVRLTELARSDNAVVRQHAEIALSRLSTPAGDQTAPPQD